MLLPKVGIQRHYGKWEFWRFWRVCVQTRPLERIMLKNDQAHFKDLAANRDLKFIIEFFLFFDKRSLCCFEFPHINLLIFNFIKLHNFNVKNCTRKVCTNYLSIKKKANETKANEPYLLNTSVRLVLIVQPNYFVDGLAKNCRKKNVEWSIQFFCHVSATFWS